MSCGELDLLLFFLYLRKPMYLTHSFENFQLVELAYTKGPLYFKFSSFFQVSYEDYLNKTLLTIISIHLLLSQNYDTYACFCLQFAEQSTNFSKAGCKYVVSCWCRPYHYNGSSCFTDPGWFALCIRFESLFLR